MNQLGQMRRETVVEPCHFTLQGTSGVEEIPTEFAQRYNAQVCFDCVRWPSQLRNSDMPGAIQTSSPSRRWG
jgi:hypothetical protein